MNNCIVLLPNLNKDFIDFFLRNRLKFYHTQKNSALLNLICAYSNLIHHSWKTLT